MNQKRQICQQHLNTYQMPLDLFILVKDSDSSQFIWITQPSPSSAQLKGELPKQGATDIQTIRPVQSTYKIKYKHKTLQLLRDDWWTTWLLQLLLLNQHFTPRPHMPL